MCSRPPARPDLQPEPADCTRSSTYCPDYTVRALSDLQLIKVTAWAAHWGCWMYLFPGETQSSVCPWTFQMPSSNRVEPGHWVLGPGLLGKSRDSVTWGRVLLPPKVHTGRKWEVGAELEFESRCFDVGGRSLSCHTDHQA